MLRSSRYHVVMRRFLSPVLNEMITNMVEKVDKMENIPQISEIGVVFQVCFAFRVLGFLCQLDGIIVN